MGTQRASNKDVLNAIEELTATITAMVKAQSQVITSPAPSVTSNTEAATSRSPHAALDGAYVEHMKGKVKAYADSKGEDAVLYCRKNGRGETKLAYCLASKWVTLKDRALIGPIAFIGQGE